MNRLHYPARTHEDLQPTMSPMCFLATVIDEGKERWEKLLDTTKGAVLPIARQP